MNELTAPMPTAESWPTSYPDGGPPGESILDLPSIAVIGKMGAGKTTCADILKDAYKYQRASFAARLKEVAVLIWGPDVLKDRGKMQDLGLKVREIDENAWVGAVERQISEWVGPVVIDDCRFPNEYWALKHRGFKFVRVWASEPIREDRLMKNGKLQSREQFNHISETAIDNIDADYDITNEDEYTDLVRDLTDVLNAVRRKDI